MLNDKIGTLREKDGRRFIETTKGAAGHAVYGPYTNLPPGRYTVEFHLASVNKNELAPWTNCANIDVARNFGMEIVAQKSINFGEISPRGRYFYLHFELDRDSQVEFRVEVLGNAELIVDDTRRLQPLSEGVDGVETLKKKHFPEPEGSSSSYFAEHGAMFRNLYGQGFDVEIVGSDAILSFEGVRFFGRCDDDFMFVGEVLLDGAYSFHFHRDVALVDVGMNIGLAALKFATQSNVKRIYAFEPFEPTFQRALDNLALNPEISSKIWAENVGLAGKDEDAIFLVPTARNSGSMTTLNVEGGTPVRLVLRNAANIFRDIISTSREADLEVFAKIDCEGAEYDIFEALESADLLQEIRSFMVETHGKIGKSHADVVQTLKRAGFIVYDRSPREGKGNGFLYAVRA